MSNKRTNKVKNGIFFAVVITLLIAVIGGTYSRYSSSATVSGTGEIAKWHVTLGGQDISSEAKTMDINLTADEESNEYVTSGKLAPGQKLSGTFKVDPTGSEVAVDYLLSIGSMQVSGGTWNEGSEVSLSKVTALLEDETDATELTIAEGGTTYFENLTDVLNGKDVTFKIYVTWENNEDANNVADTENGASITQITIPVTVVVRQHIGDVTPSVATTYTVTFKDGETTLSTQTVDDGETVTKPADPTKEGYDFVNWYSDSEFTTEYDFASIINGDTTIYAKWEEAETKTTIASLITSDSQYGMETNYQVTVNNVTLGNKVENNSETYMTQDLNVWKVFYKDTNGDVYLIYGDYLPAKCVPQAALNAGLQKYTTDDSKPYAIYGVGKTSSTNSGQNSHNEAIRDAMVSALGTASYWNGSFGKTLQGKSITATGAPTIEQFQASYGTLDLSSGNASGLDNTNTLYFPHNEVYQNCWGYRLASPYPDDVKSARSVYWRGQVINGLFYAEYYAARPVVCLPSGITGTITDNTLNIDAE